MGNTNSKSQVPVKNQNKHHQILVYGSGGVGKSTILRNIQYVRDYKIYRAASEETVVIRQNCVNTIYELMRQLVKPGAAHIQWTREPNTLFDKVRSYFANTVYTKEVNTIISFLNESFRENIDYLELQSLGFSIQRIWNLNKIQETYKLHMTGLYALKSNMDHFLNKIEQIMSPYFIPSKEDYFKLYVQTTGLIEHQYIQNQNQFVIHELGGIRSERKKSIWSISANRYIIYVVGLDQYCKCLMRHQTANGLVENFQLFQELLESKHTRNSQFILFFNKIDLFKQCLKHTNLNILFGDKYKGINFQAIDKLRSMKRIIKELILYDIEEIDVDNIYMDIIKTCIAFTNLNDIFLDIITKDGIEYIKQQYLALIKDKNKQVSVYEIEFMNHMQFGTILSEIENMVTSKRFAI